jgi:hypothetical protein
VSDDLHYGYAQLTANEIDADPSLLNVPSDHPDFTPKSRNRSGQKGGASKDHFDEPYIKRKFAMMEAFAYRALSLSAHRVLSRLEIEFGKHKGKREENGTLACTFEDFREYGIHGHAIAPAIRELVALVFIRITRKGAAGNEQQRQPTLYLLTHQFYGSHAMLEDGWKRIQTMEEAEAIADKAGRPKPTPEQPQTVVGEARQGGAKTFPQ